MQKLILYVLFTFVILASTAQAQTNPVQITSGRIFAAGNSEFVSGTFVSQGLISNSSSQGRWSGICEPLSCRAGTTFNDWSGYGLFLEDSYRNVTLTINGTTYQDVYASGAIELSRNTFQIPKFARKKGRMFFSAPFTMTGRMRICTVSEFSSPCPPNKLLLNENITGHGTLRIVMKIKNIYPGISGRLETFLTPESFEYKFE